MSRPRATCLACGHEGTAPTSELDRSAEVSMTVVEYRDPIDVEVVIVREFKEPERRGYAQSQLAYRSVPGRYGAETRCTDTAACADRVRAQASPRKADVLSLEDFATESDDASVAHAAAELEVTP